jgi:hypothetical protein
LNRYYLPALALLWVFVWTVLPRDVRLTRAVVAATICWGVFSYSTRIRYASTDDSIVGVRAALAHRHLDQDISNLAPTGPVLTSYPATFELTYPFLGYVDSPIATRESSDAESFGKAGGNAVLNDDQMDIAVLRRFLSGRHYKIIREYSYPRGSGRFLRFD